MSKIRTIQKRLKEFQDEKKQEEVILKILKKDAKYLTSLNKRQLFLSKDSEDRPLGKYASPSYARMKGRTTINLKLTGDFYNGFFIKTEQGFPVVFDSTDSKTEKLVARFGKDIFGLSDDSIKEYIKERFKARYTDYFRSLFKV